MTLEYRRVYGTGLKGARPKVYGTVCLAYLSSIASYPKKNKFTTFPELSLKWLFTETRQRTTFAEIGGHSVTVAHLKPHSSIRKVVQFPPCASGEKN